MVVHLMKINHINLIVENNETHHLKEVWNENHVCYFREVFLPSQINDSLDRFHYEKL